MIVPPLLCDYGYHITVGENFYANHNMVIQDGGGVSFGDNVFIGPIQGAGKKDLYIAVADRWVPKLFEGDKLIIKWFDEWKLLDFD